MTLWVVDLGVVSPPSAASPTATAASLEIREATAPGGGPVADPRVSEARLRRGCRRFEASLGPDLAAFCWVSTGSEWIGELERELNLVGGDCYLWNCVTLEPFRRRGLFRALVASVVSTLAREGRSRAWIGSVDDAAWTAPALRAAGFTESARVELLRLAGIGLLQLEPALGADPSALAAARTGLGIRSWAIQRQRSRVH